MTAVITRPKYEQPRTYWDIKAYKQLDADAAVREITARVQRLRRSGACKSACKAMARAVASTSNNSTPEARATAVMDARALWAGHVDERTFKALFAELDWYISLLRNKATPQPVIRIQWPIPDVVKRGDCPVCRRRLDDLRDTTVCRFCGSRITWGDGKEVRP